MIDHTRFGIEVAKAIVFFISWDEDHSRRYLRIPVAVGVWDGVVVC